MVSELEVWSSTACSLSLDGLGFMAMGQRAETGAANAKLENTHVK